MSEKGRKCYKFRKANYDAINEHLYSIDWVYMRTLSVDDALKSLYEVLSLTIDRFVPKAIPTSKLPFWHSNALKKTLRDKNKAKYFNSNYAADDNTDIDIPELINSDILHQISIPKIEVRKCLQKVNVIKNGGPDGIPNIFLRETALTISKPLTIIFNKSLQHGIFPDFWKTSQLVPLPKKGPKSCIENYRPICILNAFSKIFEKVVYRRVFNQVKSEIDINQHGFFANRSVESNLLEYTHFIATALDESTEVHAIYTDFRKAFDRVNHRILCKKLYAIGIRGKLLEWFGSYLKNRRQYVAFCGSKSESFSPSNSVPQGSILGPLLFLIFINDLGINFFFQIPNVRG